MEVLVLPWKSHEPMRLVKIINTVHLFRIISRDRVSCFVGVVVDVLLN